MGNPGSSRGVLTMKIIVVGCGKIGCSIVSSLAKEGHDVVAVDTDPAVVEQITNVYDIMGVCGNGVDNDTLSEAGAAKADLLVAVTGSDETNMLSCFFGGKLGARHTIARIRGPEYNDKSLGFIQQQLRLSMAINPDLMAARELYNILKLPSAVKVSTFSNGAFEIIELLLKQDSVLDGVKLSAMREKYKEKFLVCTVQRGDEVFIPSGDFELRGGDRIGLTATPSEIQKLLRDLGWHQKQARNVILLGGSRTAYYLAQMLSIGGNSVKIIEKDPAVCAELSEALPKAVVVEGDGAQQELLLEEGLRTADAFVTLTGMDEENILMAIFATTQNVKKVIAKANREELAAMAGKLGLDTIVSPRRTIADVLVQYVRALQNSLGSSVETLYQLMDGKAEALEFIARADERITNIPLRELRLKPNILVGGIVRDRKSIIPTGADEILPGDSVIVLAAGHRLGDLADILR